MVTLLQAVVTQLQEQKKQKREKYLLERRAMAESLIDGTESFTDEQIEAFLTSVLSLDIPGKNKPSMFPDELPY